MNFIYVSPEFLVTIAFFLFWTFVWRYWDRKNPEPFWALLLAASLGACLAFWISLLGRYGVYSVLQESLGDGAILIFLFVLLEEFGKLGVFILGARVYHEHFDQMVDGLAYGASTALGFAFMENLLYFQIFDGGPSYTLIRSIDGMLGHALFTGIFAFYFSIAFSPMKIGRRAVKIAKDYKISPWQLIKDFFRALTLHITRRHILPQRPSKHGHRRSEVFFEGFWIAVLGHFIHNFATNFPQLGNGVLYVFVLILSLLSWFVLRAFSSKWYTKVAKKKRAKIKLN